MRSDRFGPAEPFEITPQAREAAARYEAARGRGDRPGMASAARDLVAALGEFVDPHRAVEIEGVAYRYGLGARPDLYRSVASRPAPTSPPAEEPKPEDGRPPGLLTKREAAELLGIAPSAFSGSCYKNCIIPVHYGGPRMTAYYTRDQVEKVREKRQASPAAKEVQHAG